MRGSFRLLLQGLLLISALFGAQIALAQTTFQFDLPAQPLADALRSVGRITHTNVLFNPPLTDGIRAPALRGKLSVDQAFAKLLEGTSLKSKTLDDKTVTISRVAPGVGSTNAPSDSVIRSTTPGVVNANKSSDAKEASANSGPPVAPSGATKDPQKNLRANETGTAKAAQLEEVIVTGSRIPLASGQQVQPVRTYTREDIQESGRTTVADFLNTLPDTSVSSNETNQSKSPFGQSTIQLHGLPVGTTLVLLNGRRLEGSSQGFFDLSTISAAAVERIDVLPVGSSAIYGSDALAGAVNIVLRHDMNGVEVDLNQGHAADWNETNLNASWGHSSEHASIGIIATYQHHGELLGADRTATSTTAVPASAFTLSDACNPGNIYSLDGTPLPGLGGATHAGIPAHLSGPPSIQAFLPRAGQTNQCNSAARGALIPPTERESAMLLAHYRWSDAADLFLEALVSRERQTFGVGDFISLPDGYYTMGAQNPYNPFGETIGVSYTDPSSGPSRFFLSHDFVRPLVGLRGRVFSTWAYEMSIAYSKDRMPFDAPNPAIGIQAALDSADPATALNPFASGSSATPQLLQSLRDSAQHYRGLLVNHSTDATLWLRGPLMALPAGAVQSVFGGEYTAEQQTSSDNMAFQNFDLKRKSYAFFTELNVPLIGVSAQTGKEIRLAFNAAARYDHTDDFGGKATWQAGLLWHPAKSWLVRGGYAVSYKAPQLQEIIGGIQATFQSFGNVDPQRGNEPVNSNVLIAFGANPALRAETGKSRTLSLVYSGQESTGLRAELTHFNIDINNYIGLPAVQTLIDNSRVFPGGIVRAPPTALDTAQGFPGVITGINDVYFNFGELHVAGVNLDVSYRAASAVGEWTPSIAVSNIYDWQSALAPGLPPVSYVSQANAINSLGFAPRWKGTAALAWKRGGFGASVAGRYIGRYKDYQDFTPNTNELGNYWTYDSSVHVDIAKGVGPARLPALSIAIGAVNLFDKSPPFSFSGSGYDAAEYDIRGRYLYAQINAKF
jgi:iron complex outermembrane receptor protein